MWWLFDFSMVFAMIDNIFFIIKRLWDFFFPTESGA
jgi:hypothetical protein